MQFWKSFFTSLASGSRVGRFSGKPEILQYHPRKHHHGSPQRERTKEATAPMLNTVPHHSRHCKETIMIGPSILNADLSRLADVCTNLMDAGADYLHLDVMDGHFVPNLTFGHPVVATLRPHLPARTFLDLHMMVANPEKWIHGMKAAGASQYTFHYEATEDVARCIRLIREANMKVGLGIKPKTPVVDILRFVDSVDMVLIMTVEPGFGGQKFMSDMLPKVKFLRERYADLDIEVDGGVTKKTIRDCVSAGANMIVSGTEITSSNDPASVMRFMRSTVAELAQASEMDGTVLQS